MSLVFSFADQDQALRWRDGLDRLAGYPTAEAQHRGRYCPPAPAGWTGTKYGVWSGGGLWEVDYDPALEGRSTVIRGELVECLGANAVERTATALSAPVPLVAAVHPASVRSYHLGNSLSFGMRVLEFSTRAHEMGELLWAGAHLRSSHGLPSMVAEPDSVSWWAGVDWWPQALARPLHHLTLQSYEQPGYTFQDDVDAAVALVDAALPANPDIVVWLVQPWTGHADQATVWPSVIGVGASTPTRHSSEYGLAWHAAVTAARPSADVRYFPAGAIIYEIGEAAGSIPGITAIADVYSDAIHVNGTGSYPLAVCLMATLLGQDPEVMDSTVWRAALGVSDAYADAVVPIAKAALATWGLS